MQSITPTSNDILQSILGSKSVSFHAIFAKAIGSVPAAVMLSQGLFWQEKAKFKDFVQLGDGQYFSKTAAEWYDETGITEEQQKTARAYLVKCGILKEKRAGLPAKMHFRIDLESLVAVISRYLSGGVKVAVDNRSKKREITRTGSGNKRGRFAVINGDKYNKVESLESLESEGERTPAPAPENLPSTPPLQLGITGGAAAENPPPQTQPEPPRVSFSDSAKSDTAPQLFAAMRRFYTDHPNEWDVTILDFNKGKKYNREQREEILKNFCAHAIGKGHGRNPFQSLHAELGRWFLRQPEFAKTNSQNTTTTAAPVYTPPSRVFGG
jgi:hypothetical protein